MLKSALWTLRQPRYATIAACMALVALGCIAAGTWQIQRFEQSVRDNNALTHNAHAAAAPLTTALVPATGDAPGRDAIRFRTVTATGSYVGDTTLLDGQVSSGQGGFFVVGTLRTADGVIPVVRGFVAADSNGHRPPVPAPPAGTVQVTGRLDTESHSQTAGAVAESRRLGVPRLQAVLKLTPGQPGGQGLVALPKPDLSNPAGGAYEAQHFAYIVQWYLFALLALAAPFLLARNEVREAQRRFLGIDPGNLELGTHPREAAGRSSGAEIAVRAAGTVVRAGAADPATLARAKRLADRYGRSLSMGPAAGPLPGSAPPLRAPAPAGGLSERVPNSADVPHRSHDGYHGSYNDYLWELGLADGDAVGPEIAGPAPEIAAASRPAIDPVVIDVEPEDD